jgi:uncharacterized SAM-binding protein YcdF (DUF218 family)
MFFLLSKVLSIFYSPLFWFFVLFFIALFTKKSKKKRNYYIIGIIVLFLFSNGFILNEATRLWEVPPTKLQQVKKYDYAIVLGGFSSYDTVYHKMKLTNAGDRIWQTLQLYYQKKVTKIFISGGSGKLLHQEQTEADKVKDFLILMNIPEKNIVIDQTSRNTHENAVNTSVWLANHDPKATCILVTSAIHMRRAAGCFKKEGIKVTTYSADWKSEPRTYDFDQLIIPNSGVLEGWDITIKEMIGYVTYLVMGYL